MDKPETLGIRVPGHAKGATLVQRRASGQQPVGIETLIIRQPGEGRAIQGAKGRIVVKVAGEETNGDVTLLEFANANVGAQSWTPAHLHRQETEIFYVLEGELSVQVGAQIVRASTGTTVVIPPGVMHANRSSGSEPVKFLAIFTPAGIEGFFQERGELLDAAPDGQVEPQRLAALNAKYGIEAGALPPAASDEQ